jgi:hypothetical protein
MKGAPRRVKLAPAAKQADVAARLWQISGQLAQVAIS